MKRIGQTMEYENHRKLINLDWEKKIPIFELYTCLQGEGSLMGVPHILIRVTGCLIAQRHGQYTTIETEGSEFVQTTADLICLSPKLSNSTPRPGTMMEYIGREVTEKDKEQHEKWRCNYKAMRTLLLKHPDYQLKPVISNEEDLNEVKELQEKLGISNNKVWLMPEGLVPEELTVRRKWLMAICQNEGYNYTDRLHIIAHGDIRGV